MWSLCVALAGGSITQFIIQGHVNFCMRGAKAWHKLGPSNRFYWIEKVWVCDSRDANRVVRKESYRANLSLTSAPTQASCALLLVASHKKLEVGPPVMAEKQCFKSYQLLFNSCSLWVTSGVERPYLAELKHLGWWPIDKPSLVGLDLHAINSWFGQLFKQTGLVYDHHP